MMTIMTMMMMMMMMMMMIVAMTVMIVLSTLTLLSLFAARRCRWLFWNSITYNIKISWDVSKFSKSERPKDLKKLFKKLKL